jgi:hypothetical protein
VIAREDERAHEEAREGFGDAVTFAWGDADRGLYGSARLGLSSGGASAVALVFAGGDVAAAAVEAGGAAAGADWQGLSVGDVQTTIEEPLAAWRVSLDGDGGGFDLGFEALCAPLELGPDTAVARAAGLLCYEQPCRVRGTVRAGDRVHEIACLGQRGHQWGAPDWERLRLARTLSAWLGEDRAVCLSAVRTADVVSHADEAVSAWLVTPSEEGPGAVLVDDARLSTVYDGEGRQRRAGLELWPEPDSAYPRRAAGEAVCGTSLELRPPAGGGSRLRLDTAFFTWRMDGERGVGRYDVLRRGDV